MRNLSKRRGETSPSTNNNKHVGAMIANQWHRLCITRPQHRKRTSFLLVILVLLCLYSWKLPPSRRKQYQHKGRLVVALSTIPSRIHLLQPTLESLIHQDYPPDTIYLTLPNKKAHSNTLLNYTLPDFIQDYQQEGIVTVLTPEYDYGSIMKVLHVLTIEQPDTRIVYVDDDWIYPPNMLQVLYTKSLQYPNDALCLSGAVFRNYFRQITHSFLDRNHHPNLFMQLSGTDTLIGGADHEVNLAQGAFGVLVKPSFFINLDKLQAFVQDSSLPEGVVKSDDFILSAYLTANGVKIQIVTGGTMPELRTKAASVDKLSLYMYRHAMNAAYFLQQSLDIWKDFKFYNPADLTQEEWDAIDCEAGRGTSCEGYRKVIEQLNTKYPVR